MYLVGSASNINDNSTQPKLLSVKTEGPSNLCLKGLEYTIMVILLYFCIIYFSLDLALWKNRQQHIQTGMKCRMEIICDQ